MAQALRSEYLLIHDKPGKATLLFQQHERAELTNISRGLFRLSWRQENWLLSKKVNGELRPFSMTIFKGNIESASQEVLKIKDHIFFHRGHFYLIGGVPEGQPPKERLSGSKHICRLTNFPFADVDQIDQETLNHLKRLRVVSDGEIFGLVSQGFHAILEEEIKDIGILLAASTYLMYSSA